MTALALLVTLALSILVAPLAAMAQPTGKMPRLGVLMLGPRTPGGGLMHSLQGLRDLGYVESKNLVSESRSAEGRAERLPELAAELVHLQVDIIVAYGIQATRAAKHATQTIPIVMVGFGGDPVEAGLVESLARPGGNMTGLTSLGVELSSKRLELLKEVVPSLSHVAALWDTGRPFARQSAAFETAAHELGSNYGSWRCVVLTIWTAPSRRRPGKAFKR